MLDEPPLRCGECNRPIPGFTGLQELQNLIAHVAEHHDRSIDVTEAAKLRAEWEKEQGRA